MGKDILSGEWRKVYVWVIDNPTITKLGGNAGWLWIGMITLSKEGFVYSNPAWWKRRLFMGKQRPTRAEVGRWIDAFRAAGMLREVFNRELVELHEDKERGAQVDMDGISASYLSIKNWERYQSGRPRIRRPQDPDAPDTPPPEDPEGDDGPGGPELPQEQPGPKLVETSDQAPSGQQAPAQPAGMSWPEFRQELAAQGRKLAHDK